MTSRITDSDRARIGFLGGSFDPAHRGHLMIAQDACDQMALNRLYFVPAAQNPLKEAIPVAEAQHRQKMLELAVDSNDRFDILSNELETGAISYTIDTVSQLRDQFPDSRLYWIIGADQLADLRRWHRIEELATLVEFICLDRPGYSSQAVEGIKGLRIHMISGHPCEVSSTDIRQRIKNQFSVDLLLPVKVAEYINACSLYR